MKPEEIGGLIRTIGAFAGGVLVSRGIIDQGTMMSIVGALATLAVAGWSIASKRKQ